MNPAERGRRTGNSLLGPETIVPTFHLAGIGSIVVLSPLLISLVQNPSFQAHFDSKLRRIVWFYLANTRGLTAVWRTGGICQYYI